MKAKNANAQAIYYHWLIHYSDTAKSKTNSSFPIYLALQMNPFEIKIPQERMNVLTILALALPGGAFMFLLIIAVAVKPIAMPLNFALDTLGMVFLAQFVFIVPLAYIVPGIVMKANAKQIFKGVNLLAEIERESMGDEPPQQIERFIAIYSTKMIIGLALLEGVALFGIIAYMVEESMITLIGAVVLILLMFTKFPTLSNVQNSLANLARDQQIDGDRKI